MASSSAKISLHCDSKGTSCVINFNTAKSLSIQDVYASDEHPQRPLNSTSGEDPETPMEWETEHSRSKVFARNVVPSNPSTDQETPMEIDSV